MTAYLITGTNDCGVTRRGDARKLIVHAPSSAVALRLATKAVPGMSAAYWAAATATAIDTAATDWTGWTARCQIRNPTTGIAFVDVSSVATGTMDALAAALVTALNATAINAAAYNSTTNVLTVAGTADALGDQDVVFDLIPPASPVQSVPADSATMNVPLGTVTDKGSSGSALTVALPADNYAIPAVIGVLKG